ncbi:cupredoxin domain-containing protein [uncultured Sulfitobacter sp.]|jgi:plastocyanin|uniref:cupredoxin domain-containing protein n=1 Tax=Sulfitobacter sp. SH22 TaxID=3421172 RepID=UPI0025F1944E|nr:hypothetical protein [uncultured Sulfitobacter sp.]
MPISFHKGAMSLVAFTFAICGNSALAQTQNVMILDQAFFPAVIYVVPGDVLNFTNSSDHARTVKATDGTWESEALSPGSSFTYVVDTASPLAFSSTGEAAPVEGEEPTGPVTYEGTISFDEPPLTE